MPGQGDGMSDAKHTPAPWEHDGKGSLFIAEAHRTVEPVCCGAILPTGECCGNPVAGEGEPEWEFAEVGRMSPEDAERTRVCVNACEGTDAASLEAMPYARLRALNEELVEALDDCSTRLRACVVNVGTDPEYADVLLQKYRAVVARAKGGSHG